MIRRIILENYMSHARTVIEPAAGLTVLVGPNNCGKSAVISALLSLRGDGEQAGEFMVRHGEKLCSVTVETDDAHSIVWRRKGTSVSYVIDGVEVHRAGRGNAPDRLAKLLRMPRIEPANTDRKFDLHFGLQKEPIFLIDSESDAARFFSASNDAERLLQMQQLQKERVKGARGEKRRTEGELARIDGKLAALSPLGPIDGELVEAERRHEELTRETKRVEDMRRLIGEIVCQELEAFRLRKIVGELGALTPPPVPHDTVTVRQLIGRIRDAEQAASIRGGLVGILRGLRDVPGQEDESALKQVVTTYGYANQFIARLSGSVMVMEELREPPAQEEIGPLAALVEKMGRLRDVAEIAAKRKGLLAKLGDPPMPMDPGPLRQLIERCDEARRRIEQRRKTHAKTLAEWAIVEREIDRWVCENPACPVCGGETDRERLLGPGPLTEDGVHA